MTSNGPKRAPSKEKKERGEGKIQLRQFIPEEGEAPKPKPEEATEPP